jgi:hypothetical protein
MRSDIDFESTRSEALAFSSGMIRRVVLACVALAGFAMPTHALAADQLWWSNASTGTQGLVRSNPDGTGVIGVLPRASTRRLESSVVDPARGRVYWITRSDDVDDPGVLYRAQLDGTNIVRIGDALGGLDPDSYSASSLSIDTVTQKLYWGIVDRNDFNPVRIRWSSADGSSAGTLYQTTTTPELTGSESDGIYLAIDHESNRIWWTNHAGRINPDTGQPPMGYANLDGTGGAQALRPVCESMDGGASITPDNATSIVVDRANGYIYAMLTRTGSGYGPWFVGRMRLDGTECVQIATDSPCPSFGCQARGGLLDPDTHMLFHFRVNGSAIRIDTNGSLPANPPSLVTFDPAANVGSAPRLASMIKPPHLAGPLVVSASGSSPGATLSCACTPVDDQVAMRVYRGAATQSIAWYRDGVLIPGETGTTLVADRAGSYTAVLTAANVAGELVVTSNPIVIEAAASSSASAASGTGAPVVPKVQAKPSIRVVSAGVAGGSRLVATVRVNRAGRVSVAGVLGGVKGCTATARAKKAGVLSVSCVLGASAQARAAAGPVVLRTVARLSVSGGVARDASRSTVQPFRPTPVTG